jgi:hypothetical protein
MLWVQQLLNKILYQLLRNRRYYYLQLESSNFIAMTSWSASVRKDDDGLDSLPSLTVMDTLPSYGHQINSSKADVVLFYSTECYRTWGHKVCTKWSRGWVAEIIGFPTTMPVAYSSVSRRKQKADHYPKQYYLVGVRSGEAVTFSAMWECNPWRLFALVFLVKLATGGTNAPLPY